MTAGISLRLAAPGDGVAMADLNSRLMTGSSLEGFFLYDLAVAEAEGWICRGSVALAEHEGRLVGMAACSAPGEMLRGERELGYDYGWQGGSLPGLEKLGVLPPFRRQGLAARLAVLASAGRPVLSTVAMEPVENRASVLWHARQGFAREGFYRRPDGQAFMLLRGTPRIP